MNATDTPTPSPLESEHNASQKASSSTPHTQSTGELDDKILCDLHDLGFHGKSLAHLEQLAEYIRTEACRLAREVIGKDETLDDLDRTAEVDYLVAVMRKKRNELRAEQRTRLQSLVKEGTENEKP